VSPQACEQLREAAHRIVRNTDLEAQQLAFDPVDQSHGDDPWFLDSGAEVRAFLEPQRDRGKLRVNKLGHGLHDRLPLFDRFSRDPRIKALICELGIRNALLLQSMVIFKHPRVGAAVPAHQDASYLYTEPHSVIGLWFALEPSSAENGALQVLPGGHRQSLRSRYHRVDNKTFTERLDPTPLPRAGWRTIEASTGTLIAFHGHLPHRSPANRSAHARCAYTLHVIDAAADYAADNWLQRPADRPLRGFDRSTEIK